MATMVLGAAGEAIGGAPGSDGALIGRGIGVVAGIFIDASINAALTPNQRFEGPRLTEAAPMAASEGSILPRVFGAMRVPGVIIWATDYTENISTESNGGKGSPQNATETTTYTYTTSWAVALSEGVISGIRRIWSDGEVLDYSGLNYRLYLGDDAQMPDPLIQSLTGSDATPAYRGTAYIVFEDVDLSQFGNRIPQMQFEIIRPFGDAQRMEKLVKGVTLIPASGEFAYDTEPVREIFFPGIVTAPMNVNTASGETDVLQSLDDLELALPEVADVALVVSWFFDDLRAGVCEVKPGIERAARVTTPNSWDVAGAGRGGAHLISSDPDGNPYFGGTPSDDGVVRLIQELKSRGHKVTFYPFIMGDIPPGNTLANPYGGSSQPVFPWRGRITSAADKTATARTDIDNFFNGTWGIRRMIMHYANLCQSAGGVDAFLIGSEMRGITTVRDDANAFPAVDEFSSLAADVRGVVGAGTQISYAADWTEYGSYQAGDGSGDIYFPLDPLWADANIDFVGIDNYAPLSDWRDGNSHLDKQTYDILYDAEYLQSQVEGGEGYDYYYASQADRDNQVRTPINDTAHGENWIFRTKDFRNWWLNAHHNRPNGARSGASTAWVPQSKPIRFTEYGFPAVDKGTNQPNVFYDPKSSESFLPYYARANRNDAIQRFGIEALLGYWENTGVNPVSSVYGGSMLDLAGCYAWTWDTRPFPAFPALTDVWSDGPNYNFGHWLQGRAGASSVGLLIRELCISGGLPAECVDTSQIHAVIGGYAIAAIESARASLNPLMRMFGIDAIESEGIIRFQQREDALALEVTSSDLFFNETGDNYTQTRGQESELSHALKWRGLRADEDYNGLTVEARRTITPSIRVSAEEFPISVYSDVFGGEVKRALEEMWAGRQSLSVSLPPQYQAVEVGDRVAITDLGLDAIITRIGDMGVLEIQGRNFDPAVYGLTNPAPRASSPFVKQINVPPSVVVAQAPQLRADDDSRAVYVAAQATPWPTALGVWYADETAASWTLGGQLASPAILGTLNAPVSGGVVDAWDYANDIDVTLYGGTITSGDRLAVLAGENRAVMQSQSGGWEVVQWQNATLTGADQYTLDALLRGGRGSETATQSGAVAGAQFIPITSGLVAIPLPALLVDETVKLRVGPLSEGAAGVNVTESEFVFEARGLKPFSPASLAAVRNSGGDVSITWARRDRDFDADVWSAAEIPLSDSPESYRIEIVSGGSVVRSFTTTSEDATYTAADQTSDGVSGGFTVRVAQIGSTGIVGSYAEIEVN